MKYDYIPVHYNNFSSNVEIYDHKYAHKRLSINALEIKKLSKKLHKKILRWVFNIYSTLFDHFNFV